MGKNAVNDPKAFVGRDGLGTSANYAKGKLQQFDQSVRRAVGGTPVEQRGDILDGYQNGDHNSSYVKNNFGQSDSVQLSPEARR